MRTFLKSESGQSLILMTLSLGVITGFMGMAIDIGFLYREKQNAQIAADAAAVAGALDYLYNGSVSSAQSAGRAAASTDGYTNGTGGTVVTINMPPASGPNTGSGYVEAIVSKPKTLSFLAFLEPGSATVSARAVAGTPQIGNACIWLLASTGTGLYLKGSYDIEATQCGIYVNSSSSNAVSVTGNGGTMNTKFVDVVGNVVPGHQTSPTAITANAAARKSPWGNLNGPSIPGDCGITSSLTEVTSTGGTSGHGNQSTVQATTTNPVVCFTNSVTLDGGVSLTGLSGSGAVYVFEKNVTFQTTGTINIGSATYNSSTGTFSGTSGAVMELQGSSSTITNTSNYELNIYAPTSGSYNGIAILQPSTNSHQLQIDFGATYETFDGYIYAPAATVITQDQGGTGVTASGIVADLMHEDQTTVHIPSYDVANSGTTPNRVISLVE
jgi:hypothetical protein